jgi:hypothetical protein
MFRRITATIILSLLSFAAWAGTATLTWVPPTKNTDGTDYTDYGGFKIYYQLRDATSGYVIDLPDNTNTMTTYVVTNLVVGTWDFQMTAYNASNNESEKTGIVSKVVLADTTPLPPGLAFTSIETYVYNVVKKTNGFVLVPVGTIPLNTPCDITYMVNGKFGVPTSAVTWLGTVKPIVVVTSCSVR